ncbi:MAG: GNAT family N-acetyltransferase [Mycobacteriales bacterium]
MARDIAMADTGRGRDVIRAATPDDVPVILDLITDLAAYEREPESVTATQGDLQAALFGPQPHVWCHIAEVDGVVAGFAVWFLNFSTWLGKHGIYLEDLYVRPQYRGSGLGLALLRAIAATAVQRGYGRVEWSVLDWNTPSIEFYRRVGAQPMDEWTTFRLTGESLNALNGTSE